MADVLTSPQRSACMRAVRAKNTTPELTVRKILRELGFPGYRLHRRDLPGKPDISFLGRKKIIFVHGCFWHGHNCARGSRIPLTNQSYWLTKIEKNRSRDRKSIGELRSLGFDVMVIWECQSGSNLIDRLKAFVCDMDQ